MSASPIITLSSDEEWEPIVNQSKIPVLVHFYARFAPPCEDLQKVLGKLSKEFPEIKFVLYDIERLESFQSIYVVTGIPTMILFKPGPSIFERLTASHTADMLRPLLKKLIAACEPVAV